MYPSPEADHYNQSLVIYPIPPSCTVSDHAPCTTLTDWTDFADQSSITSDFLNPSPDLASFTSTNQTSCDRSLSPIPEIQQEVEYFGIRSSPALWNLGSTSAFEDFIITGSSVPWNPAATPLTEDPWTYGLDSGTTSLCSDSQSVGGADYMETASIFSSESSQTSCPSECIFPWAYESTSVFDSRVHRSLPNHRDGAYIPSNSPKGSADATRPLRAAVQKSRVLSRCQVCDRSYKYSKDLQRHKRLVHNENPEIWYCPQRDCKRYTQGFTRKDKFCQHTKTHDGDFIDPTRLDRLAQSCAGMDQNIAEESLSDSKIIADSAPSSSTDMASNVCEATPSTGIETGQKKTYKCTTLGCQSRFIHQSDLLRHEKSVHMNQEGYRCAFVGCKKADKIWTRLDNFKVHLVRRHGDADIDQLVEKSRFRHGAKAGFPFTFAITTPDTVFQQINAVGIVPTEHCQWEDSSPHEPSNGHHTAILHSWQEWEEPWESLVDLDR